MVVVLEVVVAAAAVVVGCDIRSVDDGRGDGWMNGNWRHTAAETLLGIQMDEGAEH